MLTIDELEMMNDEDVIYVNRVQLNNILVTEVHGTKTSREKMLIVQRAITELLENERKQKRILPGVEMKVRDVKKVFSGHEDIPDNAFMKLN